MRLRLLVAVSLAALVVTLGAASWAVGGSGASASVTASDLDAGVPSTTAVQGGVTLTWPSASPPPDQWQVVRATSPAGPWLVIATLPGSATSYTDTTAGGPFYYEVRPVMSSWVGDILSTGATGPTAVTPLPANALPLGDTFTLNGGNAAIGVTQTGGAAWVAYNSTLAQWTRIGTNAASSYASTTASASSNPMLVADAGTASVAAVIRVQSGGDAIYARVSDASNWLRLRVSQTSYFQSDGTYTVWIYNSGDHSLYTTFTSTSPTSDCFSYTLGGQPYYCNYSANGFTRVDTTLVLDKDTAGSVSQLGSWPITTGPPNYVGLAALGATLTVRYGPTSGVATVAGSVTSTFNQSATLHGVGLATSSYGTSTGVGAVTLVAP